MNFLMNSLFNQMPLSSNSQPTQPTLSKLLSNPLAPVRNIVNSTLLALLATGCVDLDSASQQEEKTSNKTSMNSFSQLQKKIVNGEQAELADLRSTVALLERGGDYFCTGTLIAPRVVLTAAHCLESITASEVEVGFKTLTGLNVPNDRRVGVTRLISHSDYGWDRPETHESGLSEVNDIAALVLSSAIDQPTTPVLAQNQVDQVLTVNTDLVISGFGINNLETGTSGVLHVGTVPLAAKNQHELLAGQRGNETDTCNGDSGGPVYLEQNGQRVLVGVTSRASGYAQINCGDQGIYTLAPSYLDWINTNIPEAAEGGSNPTQENQNEETTESTENSTDEQDSSDQSTESPETQEDVGEELGEGVGEGVGEEVGEEAEGQDGDICQELGYYGDGICDNFCVQIDSDCQVGEQEELEEEVIDQNNDICEELGYYGDGICDDFCAQIDSDCQDANGQISEEIVEGGEGEEGENQGGDICEELGYYGDGICDDFCVQIDSDC